MMNQIKKYFLLVLVAAFSFAGCSKDSNSGTTGISGQGELTGTGGITFSVNGTNALFSKQTINGVSTINMIGIVGSGKQFSIAANNITAAGTYSLVLNAIPNSIISVTYVAGSATTDNYFSTASGSTAGSITITTLTATSIEGTYTAKVTNTSAASLTVSGTFKGTF